MFEGLLGSDEGQEEDKEDGSININEVFENERYYGIAWKPPALLERPKWSDGEGNPVIIPGNLNVDSQGWKIDVNPSSDSDGWLYGSVFRHLQFSRPGGRAERRVGDFVRRRKWIKEKELKGDNDNTIKVAKSVDSAEMAWESLVSPVTSMKGIKVRKQTELDRRKSAFKLFLSMLTNTMKRRKLSPVFPIDPAAWMILLTHHHSDLISDEGKALKESPIAFDPSETKPRLEFKDGREIESPENLIRELVCAAVHSRAAYGHAMAVGHLNSIYNFALLQTLHQISFNPVGGASGEANNEAVANLAGIPLEDIKLAEWHNSISRPCHYLAVDRAHHCIVLSIRGSLEIGDILSDLAAKPMEMFGMLGTEGLVHEGMMMAATYVQCNTAPALKKLAKSHSGWPLLITGHSMGGGVASILALLMRKGESVPGLGPIKCMTIGPAPIFSKSLAEACNEFTVSVVNGGDVVPRISYASVEGIFLEIVRSSPIGNLGKKVTEKLEEFKSVLPSFPPSLPSSHSGLPGLTSLTQHANDDKAMSQAAKIVQSSNTDPSYSNSLENTSSGARKNESQNNQIPNYGLSTKLSKSQAETASRRLLELRKKSKEDAKEGEQKVEEGENSGIGNSGGRKPSENSDRAAAAEILDNQGQEFRDEEGHPQPLYIAGQVLWMLPGKEKIQAAQKQNKNYGHVEGLWHWITSAANLACETLQGFTGQSIGRQMNAPDIDQKSDEEKNDSKRTSLDKRRADELTSKSDTSSPGDLSPKRCKVSDKNAQAETDKNTSVRSETNIETPLVLRVQRDYFERILITMEMMQDHLPDSYLRIINSL